MNKGHAKLAASVACFLAFVASPATAQDAAPSLTISGVFMSTHDRLPPVELHGIVVKHNFRFTLAGGKAVSEEMTFVPIRNSNGELQMNGVSFAGQHTLGGEGEKVAWRVLGPHALQRTGQGQQYAMKMTFNIDDRSRSCALTVKYFAERGFTDIIMKRGDNGELAHFSLDRVISAQCRVE